MDAELKKQQETREILEAIAKGKNVTDTILVPLMQANDFDVTKCVDVLLEMISDPVPTAAVLAHEQKLKEEQKILEEFKRQLETQRKVEEAAMLKPKTPPMTEVISAELKRKEELERKRLETVEAERRQFAQMRRNLEEEWRQRMEEQQKELEARKKQIEEERQRVLNEQLAAVGSARNKEFQDQVQALLSKRLAEEQAKSAAHKEEVGARQEEQQAIADSAAPVVVEVACAGDAEPGSRITVYWEYKLGRPSQSDWIGYFKRSRPVDSRDYYTYQRTGGTEKGSVEFIVPNKLGICELRFFQNNSYKVLSRSGAIRVGNNVSVDAAMRDGTVNVAVKYADKAKQHSTWDWLGLYRAEEADNRCYYEGMCAYVTRDTIPFSAPKRPGRYVVRYFQSGSGYSELAVSNYFDIDDNDSLKVICGGNTLAVGDTAEVVWRIESINTAAKDWVGLFREGEINPLSPLAMQYTNNTKPDGTLKFILSRGLVPGKYEFVYMQARSGSVVKRSLPFNIQ